MNTEISRSCFLKSTGAGVVACGALAGLAERLSAATPAPPLRLTSKVRVGKIYLGREHPGWPTSKVDVPGEMKRYESELAKLSPRLGDVEFVDAGLASDATQLAQAKEKFKDVDGILVMHLTMGITAVTPAMRPIGGLPVRTA